MILFLALMLATGTVVESIYSTAVAKRFVYGTWWFAGFLLILGVNVLCSALSRYPWKKYQTGFVITHLGILIVLAGALVTQQLGTDGQIALGEGEQGNTYQEDKPTLYYQIADGPVGQAPAAFTFRPPNPDRPLMINLSDGGVLMVDQFLLNAQKRVEARTPDKGEAGVPAIHLALDSSFVHENQWLFLGDPDRSHLDLGPASVFFEKESDWKKRTKTGDKEVGMNALAVLVCPDGSLKYQTRHRGEFGPLEAMQVGKDYPTQWMDMMVKVQERLSTAVPMESFDPEPLPNQKDPEPAIHYEVIHFPDKKEGWLGYQAQANVPLAATSISLAYGPKQGTLPFSLQLRKFHLGYDPGTEKPASYASDIYYIDPEKGVQVPAEIHMNHPLHFKGYTVFQASYSTDNSGKFISVFSVGRDPGIWLKYGGALVLVFGIILMFWFKNPAWKKRENHA